MTDIPAPVANPNASLKTLMIVATVVGGIWLVLSIFPLLMSPMIFDSGESTTAWAVFIFIWCMPLLVLVGLGLGWVGLVIERRAIAIAGLIMAAFPVLLSLGVLTMAGFF